MSVGAAIRLLTDHIAIVHVDVVGRSAVVQQNATTTDRAADTVSVVVGVHVGVIGVVVIIVVIWQHIAVARQTGRRHLRHGRRAAHLLHVRDVSIVDAI